MPLATKRPSRVFLVPVCTVAVLLGMWSCGSFGSAGSGAPRSGDSLSQAFVAPPRPTPAAPFATVDSASNAQVLAYAATLEFVDEGSRADTATVTESGRQALLRFSPEVGSRTVTSEQLPGGRIMARWMRSGDSVQYPLNGMHGYIWIDSAAGGWRTIYFSTDPLAPRVVAPASPKPDSANAADYPLPKGYWYKGGPIPFGCVLIDKRIVCPHFALLTAAMVDSAYRALIGR